MDFENIQSIATQVLTIAGAVYVAVTAINAALLPLAKLTKTAKDDEVLGRVDAFLRWSRSWLDKIGVTLPGSDAEK